MAGTLPSPSMSKSVLPENHTTHVLMQITKVVNTPRMWRYLYAVFSQCFRDQIPAGPKYHRRNDNPRIFIKSFSETWQSKIRSRRIAFVRQGTCPSDVCSVANCASLQIKFFPVSVIRDGHGCLRSHYQTQQHSDFLTHIFDAAYLYRWI